jgi:hypothetical protein
VNLLAMCYSVPLFLTPVYAAQRRERRCFAAQRDNAQLPQTLAFWALWHCRHARPPDVPRTRH